MSKELVVSPCREVEPVRAGLMTSAIAPSQIVETIKYVHSLIKDAMSEGIDGDYAVIPGTKKKTLLKPGAEKMLMAFGLAAVSRAPQVSDLGNNHREVIVETEIRSLRTGEIHAVGIGSCSTLEKKYRYRPGPVEFTGKPVPREYWTDRKQELLGGPGYSTAKNPDNGGQWEIVLKGAEIENPDPADQWNTVLKMAGKRSMIDGVLRATASSAMFTQDMEDTIKEGDVKTDTETKKTSIKSSSAPASTDSPIITRISKIAPKVGKGPCRIFDGAGTAYNTFSDSFITAAQEAHDAGIKVKIDFKKSQYGLDIVTLEKIEERQPGEDG